MADWYRNEINNYDIFEKVGGSNVPRSQMSKSEKAMTNGIIALISWCVLSVVVGILALVFRKRCYKKKPDENYYE